jgi:hypothetical protein
MGRLPAVISPNSPAWVIGYAAVIISSKPSLRKVSRIMFSSTTSPTSICCPKSGPSEIDEMIGTFMPP